MKPQLIIVNGLPATGKTTLSKQISQLTNIPTISKDDIKELFFDQLGIKDREWSAILGASSIETLYLLAEQLLCYSRSIIIEAPFQPNFSSHRLKNIAKKNDAEILEIYCLTDPEVRHQRGQGQQQNDERHPGHLHNYQNDDDQGLLKKYAPMKIGNYIEVDTSYPEKIDIELVTDKIHSAD